MTIYSLTPMSFVKAATALYMTKATLLKKLGERVASLRKKQGLTQSDLARLAGKDRQSIYKVEKGTFNATIFYISEIAKALKVKISELTDID
jgi:transcriptional regulator with XRE-family HTH domain